jgi:hypothetical protein
MKKNKCLIIKSKVIYYDSSINIFFFLNEQGEEVECDERGVEVKA